MAARYAKDNERAAAEALQEHPTTKQLTEVKSTDVQVGYIRRMSAPGRRPRSRW
jgi:hypothetical protein